MLTFSELKEILKPNQAEGNSHYTKSKLFDLLDKRGLISEEYDTSKEVKAKKDIDPKYIFLRQIQSNPNNVKIHDLKTDKVVLIHSYTELLWPWIKIPK